ncbi:MAG: hypothetical protein HY063_00605 [Bacteroidetes bacterium]|nr:hypothetical protein [Bacteroidota bacterium]
MGNKGNKKLLPGKNPQKRKVGESFSLFERLNKFFEKRENIFFWICFFLMIIFSILFFDVKVSDGGDDSSYIVRAYKLLHNFQFPGYQGPLYPMVLSLIIGIFGMKLVVLKSFSLLFLLGFIYLFNKGMKDKIPPLVFYYSLFITSVNYFVLYFASQTYSEAFFFLIQSVLFFIVFNNNFIGEEKENISIKKDYKKFLLLGFWLAVVFLSKNIGMASVIAISVYFLIERKWKSFLFTGICFAVFYFSFNFLEKTIWNISDIQIKGDSEGLMRKDFYNPSEGNEDFSGFVQRFIDNSNLYLSRHLYIFTGLKNNYGIEPWLTILTYVLFCVAFYFTLRKNKYLLFTGIYIGAMLGVTFVVLQKIWDQWRLIAIYYPYILLFILGGLYYIFEVKKRLQFIFIGLLLVIAFTTLKGTFTAVGVTKDILKKNIQGDMLYGMHPGWANFIRMSQYAAEHVPEGKKVASRKADMSFVYTGREFYPIYTVPKLSADSVLNLIQKDTSSVYVTVIETDIFRKPGLERLYESYRFYVKTFLSGEYGPNSKQQGNVTNILYAFPKIHAEQLINYLVANKVPYEKGIKNIIDGLRKKYDNLYVYDPDMLLKILKHENVDYAIITNIKYKNNYGKEVTSMGTVSNFLHFIELKYPILSVEHKIGDENVDGAMLLQIHYERLNTAVVKI